MKQSDDVDELAWVDSEAEQLTLDEEDVFGVDEKSAKTRRRLSDLEARRRLRKELHSYYSDDEIPEN